MAPFVSLGLALIVFFLLGAVNRVVVSHSLTHRTKEQANKQ